MTEFAALRPKTYSYLTNDGDEDKEAKGTKNFVIKSKLNLKIINFVQNQLNLKIKQIN